MTDDKDILPWYRHFWPWFVLFLLGSAVTASLYTFYIASQGNDSLVIDRSGGTDVVTEENIAAQGSAETMGLAASMTVDQNTGSVHVVLTSGSPDPMPATLELWVSHPTFADRDERTTLTASPVDETGRPTWSGFLLDVPIGKRYIVLSDGTRWRLNGVWQDRPNLRLTPAGPASDD